MIRVEFDQHCAYKPFELGWQIAQHTVNKVIPLTFKFLMYQDKVVSDNGKIDDSKHTCSLLFLDDVEGTETSLKTMNDIAYMLVDNKNSTIGKECKEDEGVSLIVDDEAKKYKIFGSDIDKRLKIMRLDYGLFQKRLEESRTSMANCDRFGYDSYQKCYYCISNINENGLKSFKDNGLSYLDIYKEQEFFHATQFVQKHWPDSWQEMTIKSVPIDLCRRFYDEEDKVWRHKWSFCFKIIKKDGSEVDGDHSISRAEFPLIDSSLTCKDISKELNYYCKVGLLHEDDKILLIDNEEQGFLYIKNETELSEEIRSQISKCTVENAIESLDNDEDAYTMSFINDFQKFFEAFKDQLISKASLLKFHPQQIFD